MTDDKSKPILRIQKPDGSIHEAGVEELALINHVNYQALVTLLIKKGLIDVKELLGEVNRVHTKHLEG